MKNETIITVDNQEYILENMSDIAKQYLLQLHTLSKKVTKLQNKLQRYDVARVGFANMLKEELKNE